MIGLLKTGDRPKTPEYFEVKSIHTLQDSARFGGQFGKIAVGDQ